MIDRKQVERVGKYQFTYKGTFANQNIHTLTLLKTLFEVLEPNLPELIIEIGTDKGGLTKVLEDCRLCQKATIHTVDVFPVRKTKLKISTIVWTQNVFDLIEDFRRLIKASGRTIVICDGGDKNRELLQFSQIVKPKDLIMVHDHAVSKQTFEREMKGKYWDWCESTHQELADEMKDFKYSWDTESAWGLYLKK